MTATVVDSLAALFDDVAVPCDGVQYDTEETACDNPAEWSVRFAACCQEEGRIALFCTPCLDEYRGADSVTCMKNDAHVWRPGHTCLITIEPIRKAP